jgi:hypothetical protein
VGKPEGKRVLGIPKRRSVNNTKMDIREIEWRRLILLRIGSGGGLI